MANLNSQPDLADYRVENGLGGILRVPTFLIVHSVKHLASTPRTEFEDLGLNNGV